MGKKLTAPAADVPVRDEKVRQLGLLRETLAHDGCQFRDGGHSSLAVLARREREPAVVLVFDFLAVFGEVRRVVVESLPLRLRVRRVRRLRPGESLGGIRVWVEGRYLGRDLARGERERDPGLGADEGVELLDDWLELRDNLNCSEWLSQFRSCIDTRAGADALALLPFPMTATVVELVKLTLWSQFAEWSFSPSNVLRPLISGHFQALIRAKVSSRSEAGATV